jgi:MYXO-CTERM domain-containing protein
VTGDRRPRALLEPATARLTVFVLLAGLGVVQWAQMVDGLSRARALSWVLAGLVAALAVLAAERAAPRLRGPLVLAAAAGGLLAAFAVSGLDLGLLRPSRWSELGEGIARGTEALGGVRLPYIGKDPWPALTLQLAGALLCVLAGLLAVWPRPGGRGHQLAALTALMLLVVSPVVSLAEPKPLAFGAAVAVLTAAFLWLERLPVRPGLSAAVLIAVTLLAALPLGAAADREEPWFDYRAFAESLGPADPVRFNWDHQYGPIDWTRDGVELFRVKASEPMYWKAETLGDFDGDHWRVAREADPDGDRAEDDLPADWRDRRGWTENLTVSLRRLKTDTVIGAGTILGVSDASRPVHEDAIPGRWLADRTLGRGDSYSVEVHVPRPSAELLAAATTGTGGVQSDNLRVHVPFREDATAGAPLGPPSAAFPSGIPVDEADVHFPPYGSEERAVADFSRFGLKGDGADSMRRSTYARTYALARRLRKGTSTPYEYLLNVNAYLRGDQFHYSELPAADGSTVGLERFLFETHRGYCQHFSGAMALLLRMGGVPARVATGFTPGGFRKRRGEWVVRDTDAHSWVEAWFDRIGWVTVDPTPPETPARSQVAALAKTELPRETGVTPAPDQQAPPARAPEGLRRVAEPGGGQNVTSKPVATPGSGPSPWWLALLLLGAVPVAARRRRRRSGPLDDVAELERALRRAGRSVPAGMTLVGLEQRLGSGTYLKALRSARYGTAPPPTPADRAAFRRELGAGLGWAGAARAWWALPPRIRFGRRPS